MNLPGFTADASLYQTTERYRGSAGIPSAAGIVPQFKCPCPPGLLAKASRICDSPIKGGMWCDILDRCIDCFG